jgi:hypothetical protein
MVTRMSRERFEALTTWCRSPGSRKLLNNCACFSSENERLIGATYYVRRANAFAYILLARDAHRRFQAFINRGPFVSARLAEAEIRKALTDLAKVPTPEVPMQPASPTGIDLFATIPGAKLSPKFLNLRDSRNASAARDLLTEIGRWVVDLDRNLVRDFQTTGFDGRIWELFLFAALKELDFGFDHSDAVPDFRLTKGEVKLFVEAVTANSTGGAQFTIDGPPPPPPEDFWSYIEHDMPQKFGSPLLSKMRKRYWERPDVAGHPFLIALADFHAPASMVWSHTAVSFYLYGVGVEVRTREDGSVYGVEKPLGDHVAGKKIVQTNFFGQPENRHVSAILFSNAGTMAKFNRMGVRAGFGDPAVTLTRQGILNDPSPEAFEGVQFSVNVEDPDYSEGWADEVEIYHNPNAAVPLDPELFEEVAQFFLEDGELVWRGPSPRVLTSMTLSKAYSPKRT